MNRNSTRVLFYKQEQEQSQSKNTNLKEHMN